MFCYWKQTIRIWFNLLIQTIYLFIPEKQQTLFYNFTQDDKKECHKMIKASLKQIFIRKGQNNKGIFTKHDACNKLQLVKYIVKLQLVKYSIVIVTISEIFHSHSYSYN